MRGGLQVVVLPVPQHQYGPVVEDHFIMQSASVSADLAFAYSKDQMADDEIHRVMATSTRKDAHMCLARGEENWNLRMSEVEEEFMGAAPTR